MAKTKAVVDIDALVKQSLLKIANASGPLRLSGKGEDAVFSTTAGANKEAIARLKDLALPLVIQNGSGKTATVALTAAGIERVAATLSSEKLVEVVSSLSGNLPPSAQVAYLQELVGKTPQAVTGLVPLLESAMAIEKSEAEARLKEAEKQREAEAASLAALEQWKKLLHERKKHRIDALRHELASEGAEVEEPELPRPQKPMKQESAYPLLPLPNGKEDVDFRRNVARRLVSSWLDAWDKNKPEAREFLESAIWNISGFKPIGEIGQRLSFDGRYHEGGSGLFMGDVVQIARPGWLLEEADDCEYVVLKAQVSKP
ncbi:MAG TPA: hypothetical protein VG097_15730 [Gemmata sp.]|jgi:hypothetical protein|nr:hypothetical protein [Gemmata sp.]